MTTPAGVWAGQSGKWSTPIQGDAGFPDLVLAHPQKGVIFAELKSEKGKPTEAQMEWLEVLSNATYGCPTKSDHWLVRVCVWRPSDMDEIEARLRLGGSQVPVHSNFLTM